MSKSRELILLENAIERGIRDLDNWAVGTDEYVRALDQIVKLHRMKEEEKSSSSVSKDTLVIVAANLVSIVLILGHEWAHPITTRALNMLLKPRI